MSDTTGLTAPSRSNRPAPPMPREIDTREYAAAPQMWADPGVLPVPTERQGISYKWVRCKTQGVDDSRSVHGHIRQGYVFTAPEEVPELAYLMPRSNSDGKRETNFSSNVEFGGLVLMQTSKQIADTRNKHYQQAHRAQEEGIQSALESSQDARMPTMRQNSKSQVKFGRNASSPD